MAGADGPPRPVHLGALLTLLLATAAAAWIGSMASAGSPGFYGRLSRPGWAPPAAAFGPVWTLLYLLMAIAAWLVVRNTGWPRARTAMALYGVQLALNALWTWLFFAWRLGTLALIEILVLWVVLLVTAGVFWHASRAAGVLLLPYLGWVTFAAALTFALVRRNQGLL